MGLTSRCASKGRSGEHICYSRRILPEWSGGFGNDNAHIRLIGCGTTRTKLNPNHHSAHADILRPLRFPNLLMRETTWKRASETAVRK